MTSRFDRVNSLDRISKNYYDLINIWFPHGFKIQELMARAKVPEERAMYYLRALMHLDLIREYPQKDGSMIYRKKTKWD